MKLLFVINEIQGGGIATYYNNLFAQLTKRGIEFKVATRQISGSSIQYPYPLVQLDTERSRQYHQELEALSLYPEVRNFLAQAWALYEQLEGGKGFDAVEVCDYPLLFVPWVIAKDAPPVLVKLHGSFGQIEGYEQRNNKQIQTLFVQKLEEVLLERAQARVAYSPQNQAYWQQRIQSTVHYFDPVFTDFPRESYQGALAKEGIVLGRVQTWKGAEELAKAMDLLGDTAPDIQWMGGDNYYRQHGSSMSEYLEKTYDSWGNTIQYKGRQPYDTAQAALRKAAFHLIPSIWDTFNFTVVEGMANEKAIICADGAGASGLIENGKNGFVYPRKDVKALAALVQKIQSLSATEKQELGRNAKTTVLERLASDRPVEQRLELFQKIINSPAPPSDVSMLNWWRESLVPNKAASFSEEEAILKTVPLKKIARHLLKRSLQKLGLRIS